MNRWVWMVVALILVVAGAALTMLSGQGIDSPATPLATAGSAPDTGSAGLPAPQVTTPSDTTPGDSVRIRHELIQVSPTPGEPAIQPSRRARGGVRKAVGDRRAEAERRAATGRLIARAGRVLIGDGRHRPEPFPRPGN